MANIMFDNPIPYEGIAEGRRKEQALGSEMASNMMQSYFRAQALRAQREQWADETPLRNARETLLAAQAVNEKADAEAKSIEAIRLARRREKYAELGALQEEAALSEWDSNSEAKYYNFLSKNPEFMDAPLAKEVGSNFMRSRLLRERLEQQRKELEDPRIWTTPDGKRTFIIGPGGAMVEEPGPIVPARNSETGEVIPNVWMSNGKIIKTSSDPYESLVRSLEQNPAAPTTAPVQPSPSGPPTTLKSVIGDVINKAMNFGRSSPTNASAAPSGSAAPASSTLEQANQIRSAVAAGTMTREDGIARLRELGFK